MSVYKLIVACVLFYTISGEGESCVDDSGQAGTCVDVLRCPSAIALYKQKLKPSICDDGAYHPIVCCPAGETKVAVDATKVVGEEKVVGKEGDDCVNNSGLPGKCIDVQKCTKRAALYRHGIRLNICEYIGLQPKVCCPED